MSWSSRLGEAVLASHRRPVAPRERVFSGHWVPGRHRHEGRLVSLRLLVLTPQLAPAGSASMDTAAARYAPLLAACCPSLTLTTKHSPVGGSPGKPSREMTEESRPLRPRRSRGSGGHGVEGRTGSAPPPARVQETARDSGRASAGWGSPLQIE